MLAALRAARVGGTFWAAQVDLSAGRDLVLAPANAAQSKQMLAQAKAEGLAERAVILGPCDPWHLAEQAATVWADADHELALVAAIIGKPVRVFGQGRFTELANGDALGACAAKAIADSCFTNPYSGAPISALDAIALLGEWRQLIESNRDCEGIFGVARWKRVTADSLLWDGTGPVRHRSQSREMAHSYPVLAWKTRTPSKLLDEMAERGVAIGEIEDGMIRSSGLGANCVPPLSIIVDHRGAHFDPAQPSTLEYILENADISPDLLIRAEALRQRLVAEGIGKYGRDTAVISRPSGPHRRVLVTGQVEDDRAVLTGGAGLTNLELLRRTRTAEPDAEIIYKPHPDVEAGHRKGHVPDGQAREYADSIERHAPIAALLGVVDGVHVISSLAGFEALMRGCDVTTHGVPFYAGWGLTRDLGPVPKRRDRRRSLDELVAATLILYPRYCDPVTRLPCPVEVLVDRLAKDQARVYSPLIRLRELQGSLNRLIQRAKSLL